MRYVVIGAGVSGLTIANLLQDKGNEVIVYERDAKPGGLIKCSRVNGSLFHTCGGHVFNSKRQDVLDWFWSRFTKEEEFTKTDRNSCVFMDKNGTSLEHEDIPYPIENHVYLFNKETQNSFNEDLEEIDRVKGPNASLRIMRTLEISYDGVLGRPYIISILNPITRKCGAVI